MTPFVTVGLTALLALGGTAALSLPDSTAPDRPTRVAEAPTAARAPERSAPPSQPTSPSTSGGPASSSLRALARGAPAPGPASQWRWPLLVTPRVVRGFEPPPENWLPGHRGVDLEAVPGDVVVAAGAGTITYAGPLAGRGVVTVWHGELRTTYEPVSATVEVGDEVEAGDQIGVLAAGSSHCGGVPPCLHWGLLRGTTYLDPLRLLGLSRPILLPIPN